MRGPDSDKDSVIVKKCQLITADIIGGGLQLSRKNVTALQLECKKIRLVGFRV